MWRPTGFELACHDSSPPGSAVSFFFRARAKSEKPAYYLKWYPVIPIIYLIVTVAFVINTFIAIDGVPSLALIILIAGIPTFLLFKKYQKKILHLRHVCSTNQ